MATQTAIQPRVRDLWVQKLLCHSEQVVNRHQQRAAQGHHHRLLDRRQSGLQPVRHVSVIMDAVAMPSFVGGLLSRSKPFGQDRRRIATRLNRSPHSVPNVPQNRFCHERLRTPRVYVIIGDATAADFRVIASSANRQESLINRYDRVSRSGITAAQLTVRSCGHGGLRVTL
jgi:hypothetical protein